MTNEILNELKNDRAIKAFEQSIDRISATNRHMKRLGGKLHNDTKAWHDIFHSQTVDNHKNHYEIAERLLQEEWDLCHKFKLEQQDIQVIDDRYHNDQEIMQKYRVEYNRPVFKSWMATVDVVNKIVKEEEAMATAGTQSDSPSLIRRLIRDTVSDVMGIEAREETADKHTVTFGPNGMFEIEISIKVKPKQ